MHSERDVEDDNEKRGRGINYILVERRRGGGGVVGVGYEKERKKEKKRTSIYYPGPKGHWTNNKTKRPGEL